MNKIAINRGWLEQVNALPPVCLKTGQPTEGETQKRMLKTAPAWTPILFLFGIVPDVIARRVAGERVTLNIPKTRAGTKASLMYERIGLLGATIGFVLIVVAAGIGSGAAYCLGIAAIVAAIVLANWEARANNIGIRLKHKDPIVVLSRVHPAAAQLLLQAGIASLVSPAAPNA
jgi:hypothetical protein